MRLGIRLGVRACEWVHSPTPRHDSESSISNTSLLYSTRNEEYTIDFHYRWPCTVYWKGCILYSVEGESNTVCMCSSCWNVVVAGNGPNWGGFTLLGRGIWASFCRRQDCYIPYGRNMLYSTFIHVRSSAYHILWRRYCTMHR